MFTAFVLALITAVIGMIPSAIARHWVTTAIVGIGGTLLFWLVYYLGTPAIVNPFFGAIAPCVLALWAVSLAISGGMQETSGGDESGRCVISSVVCIAILLVLMGIGGIGGSGCVSSHRYAQLIGEVEKREWTQDVQPKDPKHVRLVPHELAYYLATKQLGEVKGAVGSQFQINKEHLTLQLINGELWYVAPLDFKGFSVWTSADSAPGYVMVHGEDPKMPVVVKTGYKFHFTPSAYFGSNLGRHIWGESIRKYALIDPSFEIDDNGNPWWVVTAYKPTIMWWGDKAYGVYIVNPTDGDVKFYSIGEVPSWVDRVVPKSFVVNYAEMRGLYSVTWMNSWWGKKDLTEPEEPTLIYGSDGKPYWVTGVTSRNNADKSLIGLLYTETQTGKTFEYHAIGGTEEAVLELVNNKVSFRKLHGSSPVLYNIYGVMTSIVPLLGESHSFQGVAMVDVANMQLAVGDDVEGAIRQYQKVVMLGSSQTLAPEKAHELDSVTGVVDRIVRETSGNETICYLHVEECPHVFSGSSEMSPKLRMVEKGDQVMIGYVRSDENILPIATFDLPGLVLVQSQNQEQLGQKVAERYEQVKAREETRDARGAVQNMSDAELKELMELKKKLGK